MKKSRCQQEILEQRNNIVINYDGYGDILNYFLVIVQNLWNCTYYTFKFSSLIVSHL